TVSSTGLGQGLNPAKDNGEPSQSRDELKEKPDDGAADAQAVVAKLPAWERLSIGLERAWERARALILDLEGQSPVAEGQKPARSPAANLPSQPPADTPAQPRTKATTDSKADAAAPDPIGPAVAVPV